ncbi:MAG: hypothetical protein ACRYF2_05765 [Janthinobacterium lividum]
MCLFRSPSASPNPQRYEHLARFCATWQTRASFKTAYVGLAELAHLKG